MSAPDAINGEPADAGYQTNPNWSSITGYMEVATNWAQIQENFMDLPHIAFLHKNTFRQDDWITARCASKLVTAI